MRKYLIEFIGTFFLSLTVASTTLYGTAPNVGGLSLAPFAIGLVLMVMVYAGGHVSGAHYNPAVTLGVYLRGRCEARDVAPYMLSQVLAAFVGGVAATALTSAGNLSAPPLRAGPTLLAEFTFTFALVHVVLHSATARANSGNSFYGLAQGGTFAAGALTVGGISLGAFNPALSLMFAISGKLPWIDLWMHVLPQVLGALAAAFSFRAICPDDL